MMSNQQDNKTPLLRTESLSIQFGGVRATDDVSLSIQPGETHAIIGPNGAGKTTLIGLLSGILTPDKGQIYFADNNITRLNEWRRAHLGLARTFQITSVFPEFSVLDNVAMAVQAHQGHSFSFFKNAASQASLNEPARAVLEQTGLADRQHLLARELAHGEQRQLELAMALATGPQMLLLDEPMAGMGRVDGQQMTDRLRVLKQSHTILLVEHDMDAVFALADRITVLVYGRIIATGTPSEIRNNAQVQDAYLGEDGADPDHA